MRLLFGRRLAIVMVFLGIVLPLSAHAQRVAGDPRDRETASMPPPSKTAAPDGRSYALLSMIGDKITTVAYNPTTGSRMDMNRKTVLEVKDIVFDKAAIEAANIAVKLSQPGRETALLLTRDGALYKAQNEMFDSPDSNRENREYLKSLLKDKGVSHLILITKYRGPTELQMLDSYTGNGTVEGIGFYMDNKLEILDTATLNTGTGILGAYVYVKIRLIDANTLQVVNQIYARTSGVLGHSNQDNKGTLAWDMLTAAEKVEFLQAQIKVAMEEQIPRLFKRR